jgi:hypothetical protein
MNNIGIIASVIAAVVAIITLFFTIRNSKGNVIKRIERKQNQIHEIENQFYRSYGLNANMSMHYPISAKKRKLEEEIEELRKKI